jgi:hypothetical protein
MARTPGTSRLSRGIRRATTAALIAGLSSNAAANVSKFHHSTGYIPANGQGIKVEIRLNGQGHQEEWKVKPNKGVFLHGQDVRKPKNKKGPAAKKGNQQTNYSIDIIGVPSGSRAERTFLEFEKIMNNPVENFLRNMSLREDSLDRLVDLEANIVYKRKLLEKFMRGLQTPNKESGRYILQRLRKLDEEYSRTLYLIEEERATRASQEEIQMQKRINAPEKMPKEKMKRKRDLIKISKN